MTNCNIYDKTNQNFFMLLEKAEQFIEKLNISTAAAESPDNITQVTDSAPVSLLCSKNNINSNVRDCTEWVTFKTIGGREVDYFGNEPYTYGKIKHEPKSYPETHIFKLISDTISQHDPHFNLDDYSCLVTLYRDGNSHIPAHSDNEFNIARDSSIYTVSVGAERTLVCQNIKGPLTEKLYQLSDGSIYVMSRDSQTHWQHSIPPDTGCKLPRVSFTFRKLDPKATPVPRLSIPPIKEDAVPDCSLAPNKRVLFLSDSVNSGLRSHMFHNTGLTCIKKDLFQLSRLGDYEDEFGYTDYVIISAGINDISRYGHTAESISSHITNKLRVWVQKYPDTIFIFNSILYTKFVWLNKRVCDINRAIFNLSLELYDYDNFYFLDSHARLRSAKLRDTISPKGNGIHISQEAANTVQNCIVNCIVKFDHRDRSMFNVWPLRYEFRQSASAFHDWRSRSAVTSGRRW